MGESGNWNTSQMVEGELFCLTKSCVVSYRIPYPHSYAFVGIDSQIGERAGRRPKTDRTRRSWSTREEEALMLALKDLVVNKWKSDNGFRGGYLARIEEIIKRECPNSDIKATPHISSKLQQWKKNYSFLVNMLNRSGVGFNYKGDHKIDCDNDQWEQIVRLDNNARYMRFKSWPLFDEWKEIFGKDRATGSSGRDLQELYHGVRSHLNVGNGSQEAEFEASADGHSGTNTDNTTNSQGIPVNTMGSEEIPDQSTGDSDTGTQLPAQSNGDTRKKCPKKTGNKRKLVDRADALLELLAKGQDETNARLDKLAGRIGFEFDASKARKKVFGMLGNIQGITLGQQIDAAEFILSKVEHLDLFNSLPEAFHHTYVLRALEKIHR
ncbi:hypothetical protein SASPL_120749 [Salvia splendens]|uniref:Myb/SANT-like domain-containing protein n=1 Tax=Salvia splendens TaxID=180675 RepID=A0A8X8XQ86_SALSN|nr:hypothetical protein SASPL_120749 [Salvia splendens]